MKHPITIISILYVVAVGLFLAVAYIVTGGGIGWDFVVAVVYAILSVPLYLLAISVADRVATLKRLSALPRTRNSRWERALSLASICLAVTAAVQAVLLVVAMHIHIKNPVMRYFMSEVAMYLLLISTVVNLDILLNRPIARLILFLARKRNPTVTVESRGIFAARVGVVLLGLAVYPLCTLVGVLLERLL